MRVAGIALFLILLLPMVEAVDLGIGSASGIVLLGPTSGSNTTVNVTTNISVGQVDVASTYITLWNATLNNSFGSVTCGVLNFTGNNNVTSASSFPQVSARSGNPATLTNLLNQRCTGSVNVSTSGVIPSAPRISYPDGSSADLAYSFDPVLERFSTNVSSLPPGTSYLMLDSGFPNITLTGPENASRDTDMSLSFSFNVSGNISNCSLLYANGTVIETKTGISTTSENSFSVSGVDGDHPLARDPLRWMVSCTSVAGNSANSTVFDLVTYTGPVQGSGGSGGNGGGSGSGSGTVGSGAGNSSNNQSWRREYLVKILSVDKEIRPGQPLSATVLVSMNGTAPAQVGTLSYTLVTKDGNALPASKIELVEGTYTKLLSYPVPETLSPGEYLFRATWSASGVEDVTAAATITVDDGKMIPVWGWVLIVIAGVGIGVWLITLLAMAIGGMFT